MLEKRSPHPYFLRDYRKGASGCQHTLTGKTKTDLRIEKRVGKKLQIVLNF